MDDATDKEKERDEYKAPLIDKKLLKEPLKMSDFSSSVCELHGKLGQELGKVFNGLRKLLLAFSDRLAMLESQTKLVGNSAEELTRLCTSLVRRLEHLHTYTTMNLDIALSAMVECEMKWGRRPSWPVGLQDQVDIVSVICNISAWMLVVARRVRKVQQSKIKQGRQTGHKNVEFWIGDLKLGIEIVDKCYHGQGMPNVTEARCQLLTASKKTPVIKNTFIAGIDTVDDECGQTNGKRSSSLPPRLRIKPPLLSSFPNANVPSRCENYLDVNIKARGLAAPKRGGGWNRVEGQQRPQKLALEAPNASNNPEFERPCPPGRWYPAEGDCVKSGARLSTVASPFSSTASPSTAQGSPQSSRIRQNPKATTDDTEKSLDAPSLSQDGKETRLTAQEFPGEKDAGDCRSPTFGENQTRVPTSEGSVPRLSDTSEYDRPSGQNERSATRNDLPDTRRPRSFEGPDERGSSNKNQPEFRHHNRSYEGGPSNEYPKELGPKYEGHRDEIRKPKQELGPKGDPHRDKNYQNHGQGPSNEYSKELGPRHEGDRDEIRRDARPKPEFGPKGGDPHREDHRSKNYQDHGQGPRDRLHLHQRGEDHKDRDLYQRDQDRHLRADNHRDLRGQEQHSRGEGPFENYKKDARRDKDAFHKGEIHDQEREHRRDPGGSKDRTYEDRRERVDYRQERILEDKNKREGHRDSKERPNDDGFRDPPRRRSHERSNDDRRDGFRDRPRDSKERPNDDGFRDPPRRRSNERPNDDGFRDPPRRRSQENRREGHRDGSEERYRDLKERNYNDRREGYGDLAERTRDGHRDFNSRSSDEKPEVRRESKEIAKDRRDAHWDFKERLHEDRRPHRDSKERPTEDTRGGYKDNAKPEYRRQSEEVSPDRKVARRDFKERFHEYTRVQRDSKERPTEDTRGGYKDDEKPEDRRDSKERSPDRKVARRDFKERFHEYTRVQRDSKERPTEDTRGGYKDDAKPEYRRESNEGSPDRRDAHRDSKERLHEDRWAHRDSKERPTEDTRGGYKDDAKPEYRRESKEGSPDRRDAHWDSKERLYEDRRGHRDSKERPTEDTRGGYKGQKDRGHDAHDDRREANRDVKEKRTGHDSHEDRREANRDVKEHSVVGGVHDKKWWSAVKDVCPMSGSPIGNLRYPPFEYPSTSTSGKDKPVLVDGQYLAAQALSSWEFCGPSNEPMSMNTLKLLDRHLKKCGLKFVQLGDAVKLSMSTDPSEISKIKASAKETLKHLTRPKAFDV